MEFNPELSKLQNIIGALNMRREDNDNNVFNFSLSKTSRPCLSFSPPLFLPTRLLVSGYVLNPIDVVLVCYLEMRTFSIYYKS